MNMRPGQPPANVKASPESTMPRKFHRCIVCAMGCPSNPGLNCPKTKFVRKAAIMKHTIPLKRWVSLSIIRSRMAPTVQKRLLCASHPTRSPAPSEISIGACIEPGPFSEKNIGPVPSAPNSGLRRSSARRPIASSGINNPAAFGLGRDAPRLNPL